MARQLSFLAPAAVMSAWATVMLHTIASGHINRLLSPMFRNYVLVAAVALLALSIVYLLLYQPTLDTPPSLAPTGRFRQFGRWLVLLIPVLAASVLSPSALSSTTLNNRASLVPTAGVAAMPSWNAASQKSADEALAADPNQPVPIDVTDLITLAKNSAEMKAFDGRPIRVIGQMVPQAGGAPKLVRWIMWCCAADAQPATIDMTGNVVGNYKDTDWLEVTGKARFPVINGRITPQIAVDSIAPTQEPDEPYLSP